MGIYREEKVGFNRPDKKLAYLTRKSFSLNENEIQIYLRQRNYSNINSKQFIEKYLSKKYNIFFKIIK